MGIKEQIEADLKAALLAGNKNTATTLRGIKGAILNIEIAKGARGVGLADQELIEVLSKEAKKRQESADMYQQGGNEVKATAELTEKALIERYLPKQLTDDELTAIIDRVIQEGGLQGPQATGQVIGAVKQRIAGQADGARIAALVKGRLQ